MTTSTNSSSSVRNFYKRSMERSTFNHLTEYVGVKCNCNLPSPCQEAWKEGTLDPGRRFFGCSRYKDPRKKCNFFQWADPTYTERARDVIKELKLRLKRKDDEMHNAWMLDEELGMLRNNHDEANNMLSKLEKENITLKRLLVCAIVVIMIVSLWK